MDLTCDEQMVWDSPTSNEAMKTLKTQGEDVFNCRDAMPLATTDETLINDCRVLKNMLQVEERLNGHSFCYFKMLQTDISPEMRTTVTTWMLDVCEEERLSENVFLLSVNYMDRYLSVKKIEKSEFQLLASVCMLIASKWVGTTLNLEKLIFYSAHSIDREMILNWEMLVLTEFQWDAFSLTPIDFVEHILRRLPDSLWKATKKNSEFGVSEYSSGAGNESSSQWKAVENQVKKFLCEMYRLGVYICPTFLRSPSSDHNFKIHRPSMIASAAIAASIASQVSQDVFHEILHRLHVSTEVEMDVLRTTVDQLRLTVQLAPTGSVTASDKFPNENIQGVSTSDSDSMDHCDLDKSGELRQSKTPTDVGEIFF